MLSFMQKEYCSLCQDYQEAVDTDNEEMAMDVEKQMNEMQKDYPEVREIARKYTDEQLIAML